MVQTHELAKANRARHPGNNRDAARDVVRIERELDELAEAKAKGSFPRMKEYLTIRDGIEARLIEAQSRMSTDTTFAAVERWAGRAGALEEYWNKETTMLDAKQAIIRSVVARVVIAPADRTSGKRFDPNRVTIVWLV
jgi:hypothetical protein